VAPCVQHNHEGSSSALLSIASEQFRLTTLTFTQVWISGLSGSYKCDTTSLWIRNYWNFRLNTHGVAAMLHSQTSQTLFAVFQLTLSTIAHK